MKTAYVASHWSPNGDASGYTIVVASCPTMARSMVWKYLSSKPQGHRQCSASNLLEIEPLDECSLFTDLYFSLPLQEVGIKCEYRLNSIGSEAAEEAPTMVAYMPHEKSYLMFGGGGHEGEYVLNVAGHFKDEFIPQLLSNKLQSLLPNFVVDNRGTRIEIVGKPYGSRDDDAVSAAVKKVFGENLDTARL
jgi:hypothetical protein